MGEMTAAEGGQHRLRKHENNIAGLYDLEETLGSGHFATVKLAKHVFTGEKVAVKVIDKAKLDKMSRNHIYQEVRCMKLVQHPNVIRLYQVIETNSRLCLIMELGGCDLLDYINKNEQGLPENEAKNYFSQIVCAISYCHKLHVVHRDLKPENVVFFENEKTVKITDFGFSNRFNPGQKLETSCGSLAYSAPEILLGDSYDAPAVDIWSLGVILFMLVSGYPPFHEANDSETLTMIMDCKYNIPSHVTPNCRELIQRMIVKDPEKRTTLEQITASQWMNNITMDHNDKPLVSFQGILEDDHKSIVNKMVDGGVAEKDVILRTLEDNEYNHITATYYLLAESIMRNKRKLCESANKGVPPSNYRASGKTQERCITANFLTTSHLINDKQQKTRKCSIVQEEEDRVDVSDPESYYQVERRSSRSESQLHQLLVAATISNNKNTSNETISKGHICLKKE